MIQCSKCSGSMSTIRPDWYKCHCGNECMVYTKKESIFDVFPSVEGKCKREGCENDLDPQYPDKEYCPVCGEARDDLKREMI